VTPQFFADPQALRAWFVAHADSGGELLLGYWKTGTGRPSVTWPESVDEALCVGWINGVRRRIDDELRHPVHPAPPRQHLERS
jgi:uncharacterized protein YdeI (YjbR/CyaY-like superfamily)